MSFPYLFVRVTGSESLGICAVQERLGDRLLIVSNVNPVDMDAYEVNESRKAVWIDSEQAYGVRWTDN